MSMTVKAYLEVPGGEPEIRRFAVDQGVTTSYTYLANKIPQVFTSLAGKTFDLYWKDVENDIIAFSSDDELTEALGFVNDGIFKVYIKHSNREPTPGDTSGILHPGVVCDGCEGSIQGIRYKCCKCPDYDLCFICENKGVHAEHPMIRMRCPDQYMDSFPGRPGGPHHHPPPPFGPPFGGPPFGGPPFGGPPTGAPFPGPGGPFGRPGHCKPWRKMMKRCWRKYWKDMYEQQDGQPEDESDSEKETKEPKEPKKEKESMQSESTTGESSKTEDGDSPTEEYLKDVGESVAAMLDPLGIDVAVDVECRGKRKKCHGGGWGRGGGCRRGGGWGRGRGFGPWMFGPGFMGRGGFFGFPGGMGRGFGPDSAGMGPSCGDGASARCEKAADVDMQENGQQGEQKTKDCTEPMSPYDVQMGSPPPQSEQTDGDWMVLNQENSQKEPSNQGQTTTNPPQPTAPAHPIPKMAQALEQLKAMGFNDDGGWLTQLIEAKSGDLNKVLDSLKPHQPQGQ